MYFSLCLSHRCLFTRQKCRILRAAGENFIPEKILLDADSHPDTMTHDSGKSTPSGETTMGSKSSLKTVRNAIENGKPERKVYERFMSAMGVARHKQAGLDANGCYPVFLDVANAMRISETSERLNGALYSAEYHRNVKRDDSRFALPGPIVLPIDQESERILGITAASTAEAEQAAQDAERRALGLALLDYWLNGANALCDEYDAWSEGGAPWWAPLEAEAV
jgi:hypothetical protein